MKTPRKPRAKKPAMGPPVTTGSSTVPMLHFRPPSAAAYQELVAEAKRLGLTPNQAAKRLTFQPGGQ